ncbi:potassium channel family protein [Aspergillus mulundensis]|uniref:Potassium channel domain-containing protein n=1 Tax=Aspergillus mulundensis TaxID=1810919 RepID=A0A3D8T4U8_9EURO|nr:hypothetical protein DSM5745_00803 [Aspergillus mulundensis]RDW93481.1 hypothetical protein DSM5745_00803 [Aspergillus mulundensis]
MPKARNPSLWTHLESHFQMRPPDDDEPQDWWVASTAIPLAAATTGPLANLMSIVALVSPWRNNILWDQVGVDGTVVEVGFADPKWCIALNAFSLACGLAGNIFLLCNFTRVIRYIVALPLSICLWLLSTAILAGLTASMSIYEPPTPPNQTFSQAYWSAVISAALYFLLSLTLMVNMLGYFLGHYPQNFILTDDQRTLILQTMAFIAWLAIGGAIFSQVIDIAYADAVYFSNVTILTLGFGDITSPDPVARGLIFPYAVMGIVMLGLVISSIHRFAGELQRDNLVMNHIERKRKAVVRRSESQTEPSGPDTGPATELSYRQRHTRRRPIVSTITAGGNPFRRSSTGTRLNLMREERDRFNAMRSIQAQTARFQRWTSLAVSIIAFAIVWTCGALVFYALEDSLSYFDALYFGFCCLLTIGYGDVTPTTNAARPFFMVWSLLAVPTMTILISKMGDTLVGGFKAATSFVATRTFFFPERGHYAWGYRGMGKVLKVFGRSSSYRVPAQDNLAKISEENHNLDVEEGTTSWRRTPPGQGSSQKKKLMSLEDLARNPSPPSPELAQQLAQAIQQTIKDALTGEAKEYSYEEWVGFTRLIQFTNPNVNTNNTPMTGMNGDGAASGSGMALDEDEYGVLSWDWIGEQSPLLAEKTEPEWVLDRLCESLVRYVSMQGRAGDVG